MFIAPIITFLVFFATILMLFKWLVFGVKEKIVLLTQVYQVSCSKLSRKPKLRRGYIEKGFAQASYR